MRSVFAATNRNKMEDGGVQRWNERHARSNQPRRGWSFDRAVLKPKAHNPATVDEEKQRSEGVGLIAAIDGFNGWGYEQLQKPLIFEVIMGAMGIMKDIKTM